MASHLSFFRPVFRQGPPALTTHIQKLYNCNTLKLALTKSWNESAQKCNGFEQNVVFDRFARVQGG